LLSALVGFVGVAGCGDDSVGMADTETDSEGTTDDTTDVTMSASTLPSTSIGTTDMTTDTTTGPDTEGTTMMVEESSSSDATTGPPPPAVDFLVRIENISDQTPMPTPFSPGVWVEHELGSQPVFQFNMAKLGNGLSELAEDGAPATLDAAMEDEPTVAQHGIFDTPVDGAMPAPILPGEAYEFTIPQMTPGNRLSVFTMLGESNDIFLGTGRNGVGLFAPNGMPQAEDDIAPVMDFWDVGTEANQPPGGGDYQAPRQGPPNTGPGEDGVVSLRRESTHAVPLASKLVSVNVETDMMLGTFTVQISNISDDTGGFVSPFSAAVWALHDDTASIFELGGNASDTSGLEFYVEDADSSGLAATLDAMAGVSDSDVTATGAAPGDTIEFTVIPTADNRFISFVTGVAWTNDGFISTTVPIALLDDLGVARSTAAIESDFEDLLAVFDAGTEVNESSGISGPNNAGFQIVDGSGVTENVAISYYRDATNDFADLADFITVTVEQGAGGSIDLTVTNTSDGMPFQGDIEGIVWAMHNGYSAFTEGAAASPDLEDLAEDGDEVGLEGDINTAGFTNTGVIPPLAPGESTTVNITAISGEPMLSLFAHVQPSNDTFVALGADGISVFNGATLLSNGELATAVAGALDIWDAGTEGNQAGGGGADMSGVTATPSVGPTEGNGLVRQVEDDPVWGYPPTEQMVRVIVTPMP
jgi:hypothetical protein